MKEKLEALRDSLIQSSLNADAIVEEEQAKEDGGDKDVINNYQQLSDSFSKTVGRISIKLAKL